MSLKQSYFNVFYLMQQIDGEFGDNLKKRKKAPVRDSSSGRMRWTFEEEEA